MIYDLPIMFQSRIFFNFHDKMIVLLIYQNVRSVTVLGAVFFCIHDTDTLILWRFRCTLTVLSLRHIIETFRKCLNVFLKTV